MNSTNETIEKRIYSTPMIEHVKLDNEISLQLESDAPLGPDEILSRSTHYFNNNPYGYNLG